MGRWASVECDCPNREPLPGSDEYFDRPHRRKGRVSRSQAAEVQHWEQNIRSMYSCGHRDGCLVEFAPSNILTVGLCISAWPDQQQFEVFVKVADWRNYEDELLLLDPETAVAWQIEMEELRRACAGDSPHLAKNLQQLLLCLASDEYNSRGHLADVNRRVPRFGKLMDAHETSVLEQSVQTLSEALNDVERLVSASIKTGNPIRMAW